MPQSLDGLPSFRSIFIAFLISILVVVGQSTPVWATTCDPQGYASVIGIEVLATSCIPDGMNDNTAIYYKYRDYECINGVVTLTNIGNTVLISPKGIMDPILGIYYRTFRNKEGSYVFQVSSWYRGLIDGKSMSAYPAGGVYTDVFSQPFDQSMMAPDCKGNDFNDCHNEQAGGSTVNLGTGRLSHDQRLFTLNSSVPLALDISLYYRSFPFAPSTIGQGWSHSYEMTLQNGAGNSKVFWLNGTRRIYNKYTTAYVPPKGDYSTLVLNADNSWTITEPDGLRRNFDSSGKVTSLVDRYGNTLVFAYDPDGKLASVTDPSNRTATFDYDPTSGKLLTIADPNNKIYSLEYPSGKLETVTLPGGDQWGYTYNTTNGLLETKTDPELFTTQYGYTGQQVTTATDPNQKSSGYAFASPGTTGKIPDPYPAQKLPVKSFNLTDKDQNGWTLTYDALTEKIRSKTDPLGNTTSFTYYPNSLTKSVTLPPQDGISYTTFYAYDTMGNVSNETEPLDTVALGIDPATVSDPLTDSRTKNRFAFSYSYDLTNPDLAFRNQITRMDDKRGPNILTTTYGYSVDTDGYHVTTVTDPTGATTVTRRYSNGKIRDITDANHQQTVYSYYEDTPENRAANLVGLLKAIVTPDGVTTAYYDPEGIDPAYDANGNNIRRTVLDADGVPQTTVISTYDDRNRLQTVTTRTTDQPDIITTYGYDANDNLNSIVDAEEHESKYEYDFNRQATKVTNALLKETVLEYGSSGCPSCGSGADKLTGVTDANQHTTSYSYDKASRLEYETDPLGKKYHYTYYPNGKLAHKYNATSGSDVLQVTYTYNNRGQLTGKQYADGTSAAYGYDSNGRLQSAGNARISYTFSNYTGGSNKGRLKSVKDETNNRTISYEQYDGLGQRKQVTVSDATTSRTTTYQYDSANRPWIVTFGTKVFTWLYDKLGRRETITYPNGVVARHDYDSLGRLKNISHTANGSTVTFANYSGFDRTGNRKSRTTPTSTASYTYDPLYRLTQADTPKGAERYSYDDVGNRTGGPGPKESLPIVTYAYDAANRMTHGRQLTYDYDDAGNQITRTIPNAPDKGWTLTWDLENRLTQVVRYRKNSSGEIVESRTIDFAYDPFDRRIEKKVTTLINGTTKVNTWSYCYDGDNIAAEYFTDGVNNPSTTRYLHGPGPDEHLALERDGSYYYYHADGLGSITAITDDSASATVVQRYDYDSFGVPRQTPGFRNSFLYTGREWDWETGLYYYRARYYDPMEGRFISKDPKSFTAGDVNLYGYVQSNSINWNDPFGLEAEFCKRPFYPMPIPYARHCFLKYNGNNKDTSSFSPDGPGTDPAPGWWPNTCRPTKGRPNDDCLKKEMKKCKAGEYDFTGFNCCHCVEQAMKACGISIPDDAWPNWPVNPGPRPGEMK